MHSYIVQIFGRICINLWRNDSSGNANILEDQCKLHWEITVCKCQFGIVSYSTFAGAWKVGTWAENGRVRKRGQWATSKQGNDRLINNFTLCNDFGYSHEWNYCECCNVASYNNIATQHDSAHRHVSNKVLVHHPFDYIVVATLSHSPFRIHTRHHIQDFVRIQNILHS